MHANVNRSSLTSLSEHLPPTHAPDAPPAATNALATKPATNPLTSIATPATTKLSACNTDPATIPSDSIKNPESKIENPLESHPALAISSHQRDALELLAAGQSDADVAKQLNLHRTTIYRWRTQHPRFIAELAQLTSTRRSATLSECLDVALQHVLRRLRKKGSQSTDLAIKLLCSPRFSRLAADASVPRTLRDVVTQISAATRMDPTPEHLPAVLDEVDESISAPFLPEPAPPKPQPKPEEAKPEPSGWAVNCRNRDYLHKRPPRPEILAALQDCGLDIAGPVLEAAIRRPDIEPFDIYYKYVQCRNLRDYVPYHLLCGLDSEGSSLPGIYAPLEPELVAEAFGFSHGHLTHFGPHDLTGCNVSATKDTFTVKRNNQSILTIPQGNLWRDTLVYRPATSPTPVASSAA